ncbi:MAG: nicotinate-nucleotide pyrophosphorylase, partial [Bacteroidetes bacterium]|nr:nicotinate-nucleotide pyrophosphorylase [Bacteroidota bacterium]
MNVNHYRKQIDAIIDLAIDEDISHPLNLIPRGDHSALACFPERKAAAAKLLVKADGILAGVEVAELVAHKIDTRLSLQVFM